MKFTGRPRRSATAINLTPLIDCMFLLVIFIMIAARFDADNGIDVELPTASQSTERSTKTMKRINLTITREGFVVLDNTPVPPGTLAARIIEARTAGGDPEGKETALVITGDKNAVYEHMVTIMDAAREANQMNFFFKTQ